MVGYELGQPAIVRSDIIQCAPDHSASTYQLDFQKKFFEGNAITLLVPSIWVLGEVVVLTPINLPFDFIDLRWLPPTLILVLTLTVGASAFKI